MTTLSLLLSTIIYLLAKVNTYDDLTQTTKAKAMTRKRHSLLNINTYTKGN